MEEHIDTTQVVGGEVDFLPKEALTDILLTKYLGRLQQQGTRATRRVIHLIDFGLAEGRQFGEEFGDLLWGVVFAAALACIACIHSHQVFVGIAESIYGVVLVVAQLHLLYATEEFYQFLVPLYDGRSEFVAIDIEVCKQSFEIIFTIRSLCTRLDCRENLFEGLVQVVVLITTLAHIAEQLGW